MILLKNGPKTTQDNDRPLYFDCRDRFYAHLDTQILHFMTTTTTT